MGVHAEPALASLNAPATIHRCRNCGAPLERLFVDLGMSPPCEDFLTADRLAGPETFYPLDVRICDACLLVQLPPYLDAASNFGEYHYLSSTSDTWVRHAEQQVDAAIARSGVGPSARIVEIASNDGYLLQHVIARGFAALGVEPAANIAEIARDRGIPTVNAFFGVELAKQLVAEHGPADIVIANNVFAHVPDLADFTAGFRILLARGGLLAIEVADLARLIAGNEFDTIYHEHYQYYTLLSAEDVLRRHGLRVQHIERLATHGGSFRLWVVHDDDPRPSTEAVEAWRAGEIAAGYDDPAGYAGFAARAEATKRDLLEFLIDERRRGSRVVGYGAPGKGNTLLNYCGIRTDLVEFLVDRNPLKHGRFTPGTHIPILPPEALEAARPDVVLILPWNLRDEVAAQIRPLVGPSARLVVPIPHLEVI
jgi:SAM-dependent methyltransferase